MTVSMQMSKSFHSGILTQDLAYGNIVFMFIGIDEAGRGPIAGPLSVAGVKLLGEINLEEKPWVYLKGNPYKDSKKITEKRRVEIFTAISKSDDIEFKHLFIPADEIDKKGISECLYTAVNEILNMFGCTDEKVALDGSLRAQDKYAWESVTKGDEKILEIALASIVAKVLRDEYMIKIGKKFPDYCFEKHKGYGTKEHVRMIKKSGVTNEHRLSYMKNILEI